MAIHWFTEPLFKKMRAVVRPPTSSTRRKQQVITKDIPMEAFCQLLEKLDSGEVEGLVWLNGEKTELEATEVFPTYSVYKYKLDKPAIVDKVWDLRTIEERLAVISQKKVQKRWRRGRGSSKLHLSMKAAERGDCTNLLSAVTGNVFMLLKEPKLDRAMPTLTITFNISTLDTEGHIEWSTSYSDKTATALGKRMKNHLKEMEMDPDYPTCKSNVQAVLAAPLTLPSTLPAPAAVLALL